MRKRDSWSSEYRKKKFYEDQAFRKEKKYLNNVMSQDVVKLPRIISVMLDLDGTSDNIDDSKAKIFFEQLEFIRKKFAADYCTISMSTYCRSGMVLDDVLEVLERNLPTTFKIGLNYIYEGTYDYASKREILIHPNFNSNKVETFMMYSESDSIINMWTAIIDDSIDHETYKKYQDKKRMLFCRPSQHEDSLVNNNFMSISSCKNGFDGVIDGLSQYIDNIRYLNSDQIFDKQKNMITHLSGFELMQKVREHNYYFLMRYFSEGYADENDYNDVLSFSLRMDSEEINDGMLEVVDIILKGSNREDKDLVLEQLKKIKK